jgi:hypothetical protein
MCLSLLFFPIELLCCCCRCICSEDIAVPIGLNGAFGTEVFTFSHRNVSQALADIPVAALPHKTSSHNSSRQVF